jgi:hypothetical protein
MRDGDEYGHFKTRLADHKLAHQNGCGSQSLVPADITS